VLFAIVLAGAILKPSREGRAGHDGPTVDGGGNGVSRAAPHPDRPPLIKRLAVGTRRW